jgi:cobyrinic acid a,c-diamide synthase
MLGRGWNSDLFQRLARQADVCVIEGVMGLFDGYDGRSESGSSAEMAKWLGIPAVLVVDARSMARSAAAMIYGFTHFDPALRFAGVIFNRIGGEAHLEYLKEAVGSACPGVQVLGGIPREETVTIPERHLGLVTADEMSLDAAWQDRLAELVEKHLDVGALLENSRLPAAPYAENPALRLSSADGGATPDSDAPEIAVARDAAFCFYYPDNLELLEQAGARLRFFSPVAGETLPEHCSGAYLGGGYPELFAREISANSGFIQSLRRRTEQGMPIYAECGGLMTLGRHIYTAEGKSYPMAGILPFATRMLSRRKALGYTEIVLRRQCLLGEPGSAIRGHEFHYSEIVEHEQNTEVELVYDLHMRKHAAARLEGYQLGSVLASYIHLHWGSAPEAARRFVSHCAEWAKGGRRI